MPNVRDGHCNVAIGNAMESPRLLLAMVAYLEGPR